eukprot:SAG31_NODE_29025_length_402_cov_0.580858_1_plen_63_part_00
MGVLEVKTKTEILARVEGLAVGLEVVLTMLVVVVVATRVAAQGSALLNSCSCALRTPTNSAR